MVLPYKYSLPSTTMMTGRAGVSSPHRRYPRVVRRIHADGLREHLSNITSDLTLVAGSQQLLTTTVAHTSKTLHFLESLGE